MGTSIHDLGALVELIMQVSKLMGVFWVLVGREVLKIQ